MKTQDINRIVMYAPNIHQGGGLVLLNEVLNKNPLLSKRGFFDVRIKHTLFASFYLEKQFVKPNLLSRLTGELQLWLQTKTEDISLHFNGLPPLFPIKGKVVIFIQNKILIDSSPLTGFSFNTAIRLRIERAWLRIFHRQHYRYIVQTASMQKTLKTHLKTTSVVVMPFAPSQDKNYSESKLEKGKKFDFIYVASGDFHKNHLNLLEAWKVLADMGCKPSLALTVDNKSHPELVSKIICYTREFRLNITNLNQINPSGMYEIYQSCSALIFPSKTESFGLPLIEAQQSGVPILASELDYVRDVAEPVQTFDPNSPLSIARAVKRFLGQAEATAKVYTTNEFLTEVLR